MPAKLHMIDLKTMIDLILNCLPICLYPPTLVLYFPYLISTLETVFRDITPLPSWPQWYKSLSCFPTTCFSVFTFCQPPVPHHGLSGTPEPGALVPVSRVHNNVFQHNIYFESQNEIVIPRQLVGWSLSQELNLCCLKYYFSFHISFLSIFPLMWVVFSKVTRSFKAKE